MSENHSAVGVFEGETCVGSLCAVKDESNPECAILFGFDHDGSDKAAVLGMARKMRAELLERGYKTWKAVLTSNFDTLGALGAMGFEVTTVVTEGELSWEAR